MTNASSYYSLNYLPAAGYSTTGQLLGDAVATGSPSWDNIRMIEARMTSTSGGNGIVDLDGLRIEDLDSPNPEYIMIARELLGTPFVKDANKVQDIEFSIGVVL